VEILFVAGKAKAKRLGTEGGKSCPNQYSQTYKTKNPENYFSGF